MDTSSSTPQPLPRLRVSRTSPSGWRDNGSASVASSQAGPSRLSDFTQLVDLNISDIRVAHAYTDEDEDQDQYPTPRMGPAVSLAPSSATPTPNLAGRLRELIHLVPNGSTSQNASSFHRSHSPAFHESDFEGETTPATQSHAQVSVRGIFSNALREPGDTPQKGRPRGNSDASANESDVFPPSTRKLPDSKGKRKSLSDEESVNPSSSTSHHVYRHDPQQHTFSRASNGINFPLKPISAEDSDDADDSPYSRQFNLHNGPSAISQTLHISQDSGFPLHSNLLDQDSEMQRAFGDMESSDEPTANKPRSYRSRETMGPQSSTTLKLESSEGTHTPRNPGRGLDSSISNLVQSTFSTGPTPRQHDYNFATKGRNVGQRRVSLQGSAAPALKHKTSSSLQHSDHASISSHAEQERIHEREREWNKPQPKVSRPNSNISFHPPLRPRTSSISSLESPRPGSALSVMSMDSVEAPRVQVTTAFGLSDRSRKNSSSGNRPGSALSNESTSIADFPQGLRRHHSFTTRAGSPVPSGSPRSQIEAAELEHERERNWNARRPKWHRRSLPDTPDRPASPVPSKQSSPHSPSDRRRESTTPMTALKDASNTARSGSPLAHRHSQPKVTSHSPSLTERRSALSQSSAKSSHTPAVASPPVRSRIPLSGQVSDHKSRLSPSSARIPGFRLEIPKAILGVHNQNERREAQERSSISLTPVANDQSLLQESMEITEAYNGHETNSALPSFSETSGHIAAPNNNTMHTASLLGLDDSRDTMYQAQEEDEENFLAQERMSTVQDAGPSPEESYLQDVPKISLQTSGATKNGLFANEEPEPGSLDFQSPDVSVPSFLSTPPRSRQSSLSNSKAEFQTPPPPKGLPELPEPPSGEETDNDSFAHTNIFLADGHKGERGDITSLKTPSAPGAWLATPGPSSRPSQGNSISALVDDSDESLLKGKVGSQTPFPQTPGAPGGWMYTPAANQRTSSIPKSTLNEGGLTTPVASLGRSSIMPPKTPAPPGGWVNTPGVATSSRKSVLKVRFDPDVTSPANGSSDLPPGISVDQTNGPPVATEVRATTPEHVMPVTPPSRSPRKHKRSPSVRMVDAYGNEQMQDRIREERASSPTPSTPHSRSGIRIVDALGQEVKEESEGQSEIIQEQSLQDPPTTRVEALQRVRQGIQELAEGIESLDWPSQSRDDIPRMQELDETSRALKQSREQLAQDIHRAEKKLRHQVRQRVLVSTFLGRNAWFLFCVGLVQIILVFIMYRASVLRARKLFLTNYYDPFNPDLFLYTTNPDTQYAIQTTSWSLVTQAARRGDLTEFTGAFRENLSILIKRWHQQVWDVWGDDPTRSVGAWPPT